MNISKNGLVIALLVSVAINLLIVGAAGGIAVAGLNHKTQPAPVMRQAPPQDFRFNPKTFIRALPQAQRRKAIRAMKSAAGQHRKIYQSIRKTNYELGLLLAAENLDNVKIENTFARLRTLDAEAQTLGQRIVLEILQDLDPQTRRRVIRAASHRPRLDLKSRQDKPRGRNQRRN